MEVTVVVPVFDSAAWVEEAVSSCLGQAEVREVVLVEDGSTDASHEICTALADRHDEVHVLTHPDRRNLGVAASRNLGIEHATSDYLAFLDADDVYLPNRFRGAAERFGEDPSVDGVYDPVERVFENAEVEARYRARGRLLRYAVRQPMAPEALFGAWLRGKYGFFTTPGIVVRRELLVRTGLFPEDLPAAEDTVLYLRMAALGRLVAGGGDDAVALARVHGENLSSRLWDEYPDLWSRVWENLLTWSRGAPVSSEDRALLREHLVASALRGKRRRAGRWWGLMLRHPSMLGCKAYWKQEPVRSWLRRRRASS